MLRLLYFCLKWVDDMNSNRHGKEDIDHKYSKYEVVVM